ncbi:leucine-rich repeat and transmembrane domain-containing protein 2-like [Teleopsis dalmanni]|uniref:leucine-rich repeat and transmembrane domain-containing protein 2-like n=1 Tax=Teleopsis dalmanni TaxID=139649 RepID=UPI0018CD5069|nr:leucine-rich repeat and transmembrane domain-containing protein 2-like [Teleopsis dalmanni]
MGVYTKKYFFQTMLILLVAVKHLSFVECDDGVIESCPQHCSCDVYEYEIHVNCSGQDLTDIMNEVPKIVQVLDFSKNNLTTLGDESFLYLYDLVNIKLSYNAIYHIHADAFRSLIYVDTIDLSNNCLTSIDPNLFSSNIVLYSITLEGNKIAYFPNEPFIINESIKSLNLRNTQLSSVSKTMFCEMPQLIELNLANNLLVVFNPDAFENVKHLKFLDLSYNYWDCDKNFGLAMYKLRTSGLRVDETSCNITVELAIGNESLKIDTSDNLQKMDDICDQLRENPHLNMEVLNKYCGFFVSTTEKSPYFVWLDFSDEKFMFNTLNTINAFLLGSIMCVLSLFLLMACILCVLRASNRRNHHEHDGFQYIMHPIDANHVFFGLFV